jgi:hypothetical protein
MLLGKGLFRNERFEGVYDEIKSEKMAEELQFPGEGSGS